MAKKKPALPAAVPQQTGPPSTAPMTVGLADAVVQAGDQALAQMRQLLGLQIDVAKLADPEWLEDPEHRKIAAMLLKLIGVQMNVALGIVSGQLRGGRRLLEEEEKERSRARALEDLARALNTRRTGEDTGVIT